MDRHRRWIVAMPLLLLFVPLAHAFVRARAARVIPPDIPVLKARVVKTYPHDAKAFTQGLEYLDGFLYESTGMTGRSSLRKVELTSGKVLQMKALGSEYFGEGLTIFH